MTLSIQAGKLAKKYSTIFVVACMTTTYVPAISQEPSEKFPTDKAGQDELLKRMDTLIQQTPDDYRAYTGRAFIEERRGEYGKALADINKAIQLRSDDSRLLSARGMILAHKKDYKSAVVDFGQAVKLEPNAINYSNRAAMYIALNRLSEAQADATKAIKIDPSMAQPYEDIGEVCYKSGHYPQAIQYCTAAIKRDEKNAAESFFYRGSAYEKLGNKALAAADKKKASQLGYTGEVMFVDKQ